MKQRSLYETAAIAGVGISLFYATPVAEIHESAPTRIMQPRQSTQTVSEVLGQTPTSTTVQISPVPEILPAPPNPNQVAAAQTIETVLVPELPEVGLALADVTQGINRTNEFVVANNAGCGVQFLVSYDQSAPLPNNIVYLVVNELDIFQGTPQDYTVGIFNGTHVEGSATEGHSFDAQSPADITQVLGYIASVAERFCPPQS